MAKDIPHRNDAPSWRSRETRVALVFLAPALLGFLTFFAWPTLRGLYLSLTDYDLLSAPEFSGLDNYRRLLEDDVFWNSLWVTLEYVVINIGVQTVVALGIAVLLHRLTRSTLIRGVVLLPYLISNVVVALVWYWMSDYSLGVINQMLGWAGVDAIGFFGDPDWAIPTIAGINVWRHMGYTALLIFAGLQTINRDVYEAAAVDGAGELRVFFRITLPLLRPVLALVLVLTVIGSWQVFDTVAVTTQGGPVDSTRVIQYYIFDQAFTRFDFGYASAISVVLFLILAGVAFAQLKLLRAGESDQS
ncbi:carbohydrate ABC transporter permease [Streptomyces litchfieldiae]|uniref:Sugar ABC transporter permease n=1 Tax=Streptomyces litchfieldiae TaxID=3075543 RepID=A0ABU2MYF7_9ACTN|nr:sugar ABC transporter permease [Streptomyces sp. DSM 44938]MDT0346687.1 sugar ABC transporter permease [Streptomyces sp. DSM 44938]